MINHIFRKFAYLPPAIIVLRLTDRVLVVHLPGFPRFSVHAFTAHPARGDIAVAAFVQKLPLELCLQSAITGVTEAEDILILPSAIQVRAAGGIAASIPY